MRGLARDDEGWTTVGFEQAAEKADEAAGLASIAKTHLEDDRGHKLLAEAVETLSHAIAELARAQED
ncbi:hypothetical protein LX12_003800 [Williamsia serinedens]|uniref:Uncharacterized protein n=1 Tax=Williamsia serinedens TaxID=391736 RepID=A0ABT1H9K3_9NOCA|nr:hypothetical protein [Williamsia serinedens]